VVDDARCGFAGPTVVITYNNPDMSPSQPPLKNLGHAQGEQVEAYMRKRTDILKQAKLYDIA